MVTIPLFKWTFGHITHTETQQDKSVTNSNKLITVNFNTFFSAEIDTGEIKGSDLSANSLEYIVGTLSSLLVGSIVFCE